MYITQKVNQRYISQAAPDSQLILLQCFNAIIMRININMFMKLMVMMKLMMILVFKHDMLTFDLTYSFYFANLKQIIVPRRNLLSSILRNIAQRSVQLCMERISQMLLIVLNYAIRADFFIHFKSTFNFDEVS